MADPAQAAERPQGVARSVLSREQAARLLRRALLAATTDGAAPRLNSGQIGADALAGFVETLRPVTLPLPSDQPVVLMPSVGGCRHLPVLTPLLALWLAREGLRVLVHGPLHDSLGPTCAEILHDLGLPPAHCAADAAYAWARRKPAFIASATLCPALQPLLDRQLGPAWLSQARRMTRLLDPVVGAPGLRLLSHARPELGRLLAEWVQRQGISAMLLRGADGETVVDARRRPRIETWLHGQAQPALGCPAQDDLVAELPLLPRADDAAATALYVQAVLSGEKPAPAPLSRQVALIKATVEQLARG